LTLFRSDGREVGISEAIVGPTLLVLLRHLA